jgi:hypothetical protein
MVTLGRGQQVRRVEFEDKSYQIQENLLLYL